jgi:2-oxoglutarate dehydrogenase E1 component
VSIFNTMNAGYAQAMYEQYLRDPDSVDEAWRALFSDGVQGLEPLTPAEIVTAGAGVPETGDEEQPAPAPRGRSSAEWAVPPRGIPEPMAAAAAPSAGGPVLTPDDLHAVALAMSVVKAFRTHGRRGAHLDPLGTEPVGDPAYDPATIGLTEAMMRRVPSSVLRIAVPGASFADALPHLRATYCGTLAYEKEHINSHEERVWLRQMIESGAHHRPLGAPEQRRLLSRLIQVEALERYLGTAYLGQKRFSIEGVDMLVPMLDLVAEMAAEGGAREVVMGMAHRGRLNVLAHLVGMPYESILAEFEGGPIGEADGATGDVKYHLGAHGTYTTRTGRSVAVELSANPSHLESVNPVVEGRARALQTDRSGPEPRHDPTVALPVLIHGDAAYTGQGVVAETLNLARLAGYSTGGTIHIITNNQLGFTTDPKEARSTDYASDLAKGFDHPIVHVNADDPEACLSAVRLAMEYRNRFRGDVIIDLVGYRRHGHNEADEPAYTQPLMYERIASHPTVRERWTAALVAKGVVTQETVDAEVQAAHDRLAAVQASVKASMARRRSSDAEHVGVAAAGTAELAPPAEDECDPETAVAEERLRELDGQLLTWPSDFAVHPKLVRQLERRRRALDAGDRGAGGRSGGLDWAHAEALALASLVGEGVPVRLTGQDTERGTFSQRHLVLHDVKTGRRYAPIQHLPGAKAPFELHNSPLSELAALGFEYGYSAEAPETLVLWEAQYGDFANGAQVIIDQFIVSGRMKWADRSRLALLLPHGYEGQGPEHSSARLERFLQLAGERNIRVASPTTPAQYFHLLRRQAKLEDGRPLVVMTPKSLLRHPLATSSLGDLADGCYRQVLDDPVAAAHPEAVERLVLCAGKVYYDAVGSDLRQAAARTAIARVELLYPLPKEDLRQLVGSYPGLREIVWLQEEPRNKGPWHYLAHHLRDLAPRGPGGNVGLSYVGRPERASAAEGYPAAHLVEQKRIVGEALDESER